MKHRNVLLVQQNQYLRFYYNRLQMYKIKHVLPNQIVY